MINNIEIKNFKCFEEESLEFKNLTLLTGTNSSGKSSIIQAILLLLKYDEGMDIDEYINELGDFEDLKNKNTNPKEYLIKCLYKSRLIEYQANRDLGTTFIQGKKILYPETVTYLNANRLVLHEINQTNSKFEKRYFGIDCKYVANYFERYKNKPIEEYLIRDNEIPTTLEAQTNYWLKEITAQKIIDFQTIKLTSTSIQALYKINGLEFKPENIGTGISYIVSTLIVCLSAKKENIIIIENPEIHLHPKAQAKIGEFFAFIASKGVQLIIETHNDHLINKIRYEVFKKHISHDDVIIHYKEQGSDFEKILINEDGKFNYKNGNGFPSGFYDATLKDIYKINKGN